jgi:DNA-binding GntR family transcriptional regulator
VTSQIQVEDTPNLSGIVAAELRNMFLNGELEPGEHIVETEIAKKINVSRGPVREAIRQLQKENIVRVEPRRGAFVVELTIDDLYDIYTLRGALEGLGARILAENADPEAIEELRACLENLSQTRNDLREFARIDLQFHELLCRLSGHEWLYKHWLSLKTHVWLFIQTAQVLDRPGSEDMVDIHIEIFEAIRAGLPSLAEQSVRRHTETAGESVRLFWERHGGRETSLSTLLKLIRQMTSETEGGH